MGETFFGVGRDIAPTDNLRFAHLIFNDRNETWMIVFDLLKNALLRLLERRGVQMGEIAAFPTDRIKCLVTGRNVRDLNWLN